MSAEITQEIDKALKGLGSDILKETLDALSLSAKGSTVASYLAACKEGISEKGIEHLVNSYSDAGLKEIAETLGITSEHKKKFTEQLKSKGIETFLKSAKEATLTSFARVLKLESDSKDEMEKIILEEMLMTGTKDMLTSLNVSLLKKYCHKLDLKEASKKADLVSHIMDHVFQLEPEPEEEQKAATPKKDDKKASPAKPKRGEKKAAASPAKEKESTKRKKSSPSPPPPSSRSRSPARGSEKEKKGTSKAAAPQKKAKTTSTTSTAVSRAVPRPPISGIKKGLTYTEIFDTWNATDLRDYCRQKGLKVTGKKPETIKRILTYLDTGVISEEPKKKKKKAKAKKTKKTVKKDSASTTTSTTSATEAGLAEANSKKKESGKKAAAAETKK